MGNIVEFVKWLRDEMDKRGIRSADIAEVEGITSATISRILSMERRAGPESCVAIAHALQLPAEVVFRKAGLLPKEQEPTPGIQELNFLYSQLSEDDRENVLIQIRALVREKAPPYGQNKILPSNA
jgi:transcriptional regulator with XRE-family HTH domain